MIVSFWENENEIVFVCCISCYGCVAHERGGRGVHGGHRGGRGGRGGRGRRPHGQSDGHGHDHSLAVISRPGHQP